jgi:hypothetical protein
MSPKEWTSDNVVVMADLFPVMPVTAITTSRGTCAPSCAGSVIVCTCIGLHTLSTWFSCTCYAVWSYISVSVHSQHGFHVRVTLYDRIYQSPYTLNMVFMYVLRCMIVYISVSVYLMYVLRCMIVCIQWRIQKFRKFRSRKSRKGGGTPQNSKTFTYFGSQILSFTNIWW